MSVSRVGELLWTPDSLMTSLSPAKSRVARTLAGKARYLYELAAGESGVADEAPCTPPNPQGLVGVDLSGPPWGPVPRHNVAWGGSSVVAADVQMPDNRVAPTLPGGATRAIWVRIWVRPHAVIVGDPDVKAPQGWLFLDYRARRVGGAASVNMRIQARCSTSSVITEETQTLTSTAETTYLSTCIIDVQGGGDRFIYLSFTNMSEDPADVVSVSSFNLFTVAKKLNGY